jgi:hypothetical protein
MMSGGKPFHWNFPARFSLPASGTGADGPSGDVARIDLTGSGIDAGSHASDAARITQPGSNIGGDSQSSDAARITPTGSRIGGSRQANYLPSLLLYIEASTNPLPLDYGFIAAPTTASLQHGHVNPLPKETLHHG